MPASTFVYVSNAEDGDIAVFRMTPTGELLPAPRVAAGKAVMPLAVSPDKRFLYAALRAKPFTVVAYAIDRSTGALTQFSSAPLADSLAYISLDRTGRHLFGASYGGNLVSVNAVGADGSVSEPKQVIPIGRNAHSIRVDHTNRFAYAPSLGSDQVFMFTFDANTGRLASNTPAVVLQKPGTGPRHSAISNDNRFLYVLSELLGNVTTYAIDAATGMLSEVAVTEGVPQEAKIWAAEIRMTPDGKFLYTSERTSSTLNAFGVDGASGKLTYLGSTPTEKQPRGFGIDPSGKYLVAAGEQSPTVSTYAIDPSSGALRLIGKYPGGKGANWVEIVAFD